MTLQDTVALMTSDDYKKKFQAEYYQLAIREASLAKILQKHKDGTLEFTPTCSIALLKSQDFIMQELLTMLKFRADIEDVPLEEI